METTQATVADLAKYDITVAVDCSGSMGTKDMPNGMSRWDFAKEATGSLARKAATIDADGIDVVVFGGSTVKMYNGVTGTDDLLNHIFTENEPHGGTPTDQLIHDVLGKYLTDKAAGKNPKPIILAIVTDGEPTNRKGTTQAIIDATKKMNSDDEIAISFLQVGNDPAAASYLKHLDDELVKKDASGAIVITPETANFDIVDTKVLNDVENMTETLLAALND
jgi:hypothetical protein